MRLLEISTLESRRILPKKIQKNECFGKKRRFSVFLTKHPEQSGLLKIKQL
jgi:homoserine kinase